MNWGKVIELAFILFGGVLFCLISVSDFGVVRGKEKVAAEWRKRHGRQFFGWGIAIILFAALMLVREWLKGRSP
jgi:hypothetical protein